MVFSFQTVRFSRTAPSVKTEAASSSCRRPKGRAAAQGLETWKVCSFRFIPSRLLPGAGLLQLQLLRGDLIHVEGIEHPRKACLVHSKGGGVQHSALLRHQFALFVHLLHRELFQIRQHDQIGGIARGYRAAVRKTEVCLLYTSDAADEL